VPLQREIASAGAASRGCASAARKRLHLRMPIATRSDVPGADCRPYTPYKESRTLKPLVRNFFSHVMKMYAHS
jgi:hypothetical protein